MILWSNGLPFAVFEKKLASCLARNLISVLNHLTDLSTSTQQADELPCHGSTSLQHSLLQTFLPLLYLQRFGWL